MHRTRRPCSGISSSLLVTSSLLGALACSDGGESADNDTGVARIALTQVPSDVRCIRITVSGLRTVVSSFDVTPGQPSTLTLQGLALGQNTFSAEALAVACASVTPSTVPTWSGTGVPVTVVEGATADVRLTLVHNVGNASVTIDFGGPSTPRPIVFAPPTIAAQPMATVTGLASADFNFDGRPDVAYSMANLPLTAHLNDGTGRLLPPVTLQGPSPWTALAAGDLDGDRRADVVAANGNGVFAFFSLVPAGFTPGIAVAPVPGNVSLAVADVDADGRADVITGEPNLGRIQLMRSVPGRAFAPPLVVANAPGLIRFVVADFTRDNRPDLLTAGSASPGLLFLGTGTVFGPARTWPAPSGVTGLALGDVTFDGILDAIGVTQNAQLHTFRGDGAGGFFLAGGPVPLPLPSGAPVSADFDRDTRADIATVSGGTQIRIQAATTVNVPTGLPQSAANATPHLIAPDLDVDGKPDLVVGALGVSYALNRTQ